MRTLQVCHPDAPGAPARAGSHRKALTKLADVAVAGFAALVIPVEGGRCLQLHAVAKPAGRGGECSGGGGRREAGRGSKTSPGGHLRPAGASQCPTPHSQGPLGIGAPCPPVSTPAPPATPAPPFSGGASPAAPVRPQAPRPPGQAASFLPPGRGCLGVDPGLAWLPSGRSRRGRGARESRWAHSLPPPPLPGPLGPREAQALRALGQEAGGWGSGRV